jgi:Domain of unknown function (DUF4234)
MTESMPPPPSGDPTPPPPAASPPPPPAGPAGMAAYQPTVGRVPERLGGAFYSVGIVILLMIVTLGIWGFFWTWRTCEDLKKYNGDGLGGGIALVIYIFVSPVLMFTIPNEAQNMYQRDGRQSPVSAVWGLWFLLPLIGNIIWYVKVQHALNDFWLSKGTQPG